MIRFVREHWDALGLTLFVSSFFAVALWESVSPRDPAVSDLVSRWLVNLGLWLCNSALAYVALPADGLAALQGTLGLAALPIWRHSVWLDVALGFLIFDFLAYWLHRVAHAAPIFWRIHRVHHSDRDVDVTTSYRHHPLESVYVDAWLLVPLLVLGIPWYALATYSAAATALAAVQHGNIRLSGRWERLLASAFISTDAHRLHHSVALADQCSNYGAVFSVWDRMLGTYRGGASGRAALTFGLAEPPPAGLISLLLTPLRAA